MTLKVTVGGRARVSAEFEKRRVSFLCIAPNSMQIISGMMMVKRKDRPGMPPAFFGPIAAGWENIRAQYPELTADLKMVGALIAAPEGEFRGQIDWVIEANQPREGNSDASSTTPTKSR
jgi:hypothetical protein